MDAVRAVLPSSSELVWQEDAAFSSYIVSDLPDITHWLLKIKTGASWNIPSGVSDPLFDRTSNLIDDPVSFSTVVRIGEQPTTLVPVRAIKMRVRTAVHDFPRAAFNS
ncbi:MAG TPA: hypothetical protein VF027_07435 [Sphingomicrobium sp.]